MRPLSLILIAFSLVSLYVGYAICSIGSTVVTEQTLTIDEHTTALRIPAALGIDVSSRLFHAWLFVFFHDYPLQQGIYHIDHPTTLYDLFDVTLRTPPSQDVNVTILPGWSIYDIDAALQHGHILTSGSILSPDTSDWQYLRAHYAFLAGASSLEGFLYPDTYRIRPGSSVRTVLDTLLHGFSTHIAEPFGWTAESYASLTLASILEREERNPTEKPTVAGILQKRLREGILLGADATICSPYRITHEESTPDFIARHLRDDTAYNTRTRKGLPPTPIANPTADTYAAVVRSEPSPYYYYLHDDNGVIHYGRTLQEHNRNRTLYLGK